MTVRVPALEQSHHRDLKTEREPTRFRPEQLSLRRGPRFRSQVVCARVLGVSVGPTQLSAARSPPL